MQALINTTHNKSTIKCAVVLHLFYLDLWPEIAEYLNNLPQSFDLFVTTTEENAGFAMEIIHARFPRAKIFSVVNRGRDIAPFLHVAQQVDLHQYDCVCKIHTKKSLHLESGDEWRVDMLTKLFQSVSLIMKEFIDHPEIGIIAPADHILFYKKSSSGNAKTVSSLLQRLNLSVDLDKAIFVAGGMFWFRPTAIDPLFKLKLASNDFEEENKQIDGTLAHAIERIFCMIVSCQGFNIVDTSFLGIDAGLLHHDDLVIAKEEHAFATRIPCHWDFTLYENDVPVEALHKEIYQSRPDLRYHYPDASKVNCKHSFFHWLVKEGIKEYRELIMDTLRFGNRAICSRRCLGIYIARDDLQKCFPNPFSVQETGCYFHWLLTQGIIEYPELKRENLIIDAQFQNGVKCTLTMLDIYLSRKDLQVVYPNPYAVQEGEPSFYQWLTTQGQIEFPEVLATE